MKPKILFILHMPPPLHGAAKVGQFLYESRDISEGFDCTFVNLQTSKKLNELGKGFFAKIRSFLKLYRKVLRVLVLQRYDICYMTINSSGFAYYKEIIIVFFLRLFHQNIIYHFHNKGVSDVQHKIIPNLLYNYSFKKVRCILSSELLYFDIKKYVRKEDVFFCPYGIPTITADKTEMDSGSGLPKIIFLSNLIKEKGPYILLDACKILQDRSVCFECHIVGDWGDISREELMRNISERNIAPLITVHGLQVGERKDILLKGADIFVLPTLNDCSPLVILEAMQHALPVLTTIEGGIPDVVKDGVTGYLTNKNDSLALAEKMQLLIEDPELCKKMGNKGRQRFQDLYTLETFENNMVTILQKAIKKVHKVAV